MKLYIQAYRNKPSQEINYYNMTFLNDLIAPILKAVGAVANNGGLFKKLKRTPFNLKLALGHTMLQGM
jgi:hypothetical protein